MAVAVVTSNRDLAQRLADAEATIEALLSGQIDAVVDSATKTPVLLSKAQDALRESEERYRRIVETASEGIWTVDENSRTTFVNGQMARMLGCTVEEMAGVPMAEFIGEAERDRVALAIERGRKGPIDGEDLTLLRRDGSELSVRVSAAPISGSGGQYIGVLAMVTDRSQYRAAEDAVRRSEEQYRQIVETTADGIMTVDLEGTILFVNRRCAEMLGYEPHEMIGSDARVYMTVEGRTTAVGAFERRILGLRDANDSAFLHRDGTEVRVNIANAPVVDAKGRHVGSLSMVRDVTEQRKLQAQLMVSDRMASVGTLAAGVAHEINNPLAAVTANLDFMAECLAQLTGGQRVSMTAARRDAWIQDEIVPPLGDAREATERVRLIVRDLKIFSRAPSEELVGSVDVKATMESSLRMAWNEIRHRARLVKNYGRIPAVVANEGRLGQVFLNLIINAAQAVQEGDADNNEIRVTTRLDRDRVLVDVADSGPGIPAEIINRVFDAFFTTKAVGVGTGLGLAICHRIVTDIGGTLTVESEMGVGTTFRVSLPVAGPDASDVVTLAPTMSAVRHGRILVVDDEELVARSLTRILARDHEVVTMLKAKDALALCAAGDQFDLILCDLMMPGMTGMELHTELSRIAPEQAKKIIFITGGAFTDRARQFLSETATEQIEKPVQAANLRAIVQRYLR